MDHVALVTGQGRNLYRTSEKMHSFVQVRFMASSIKYVQKVAAWDPYHMIAVYLKKSPPVFARISS